MLISITTPTALRKRTISIAGLPTAIAEKRIQFPLATCRATPWVIRTLTITARGRRSLTTERCGIPILSRLAGLLTATDIGATLGLGGGLGLTMHLGDLRPFTTGAGTISAAAGVGAPDRSVTIQC